MSAWLVLGFAWASAAIMGCSSQAGVPKPPPLPTVTVVEARQMTVPIMAEPVGTTRALQEVSVRARVRGFLKELHFDEGGDVKAGQLLFVIDEEPFKARVAEAQAELEAAQAALQKAQDSKAREVATAQLALDQAALELSEIEERREQSLMKRNASTVEDVQRKQTIRKKNVAQVQADRANLDQAKADHETNIGAAQADVARAKAKLLDAQIELGYCRMTSPIDGRAGFVEVKLGNLVGPAAGGGGSDYTELVVIRQLDPMGVDIPVASRYLDRVMKLINQGLAVEVFRPGLEGEEARRFPGKATTVDNTINPTTSTFQIRAEVANAAKTILPGEYVKSRAKVGEVRDAIVVPEQSVVETQAGPTVYIVDEQSKVKVVPVRATFTHEGLRVLQSGPQPGQKVIVEGLPLVRSGMTVKVLQASPTTPASPEAPAAASPSTKAAEAGRAVEPHEGRPSGESRPKP